MGAIRVIRGILAAIWCCLLALSLWLTVQRQVFQQEEISLAGVTLAPVEGDAMSPTLREGDLAVAMSHSGQEPPYGMGDMVLALDGKATRLVGTVDGEFIARGDGESPDKEALLPHGNIVGKVVAILPGAAGFVEFLSALWGPPVVLAAGILLLGLPTFLGLGKLVSEKAGPYRGRHSRP